MELASAEWRSAKDELHTRQAAEKAWLAVVQATDEYLLRHHGIAVTQDAYAHLTRKRSLRSAGAEALAEEYNALAGLLHGDAFYLGDFTDLPRLMQRARIYVERATDHKVGAL